jgi:hypothetical protein
MTQTQNHWSLQSRRGLTAKQHAFRSIVAASMMIVATAATGDSTKPSRPLLTYFRTPAIPLSGWDSPAISNNWLWAQAAAEGSLLGMEDIRSGAEKPTSGSIDVYVNGRLLRPDPAIADWLPNSVTRRATVGGLQYVGEVRVARQCYALLSRLEVRNPTDAAVQIKLELRTAPGGGSAAIQGSSANQAQEFTIEAGGSKVFRAVNAFRRDAIAIAQLLDGFDDEWRSSEAYWEELLEDAYTPGPGALLSGGVPTFHTDDDAAARFYNFGIVTSLMLMKNDPDNQSGQNLYVTALPDAGYGTYMYLWDVGYASEILAMLDPLALKSILEAWAGADIHSLLAVAYDDPAKAFAPGRFYAANGSMFAFSVWNYVNYTGDYEFLNHRTGAKSVLDVLRTAADWHKTRPQKNGLSHYGTEDNLFDDVTVRNYDHYVAAPNAADVWVNRSLAELYAKLYDDSATAAELRIEADRIAKTVIRELYNDKGEHVGTWQQLHEDGSKTQLRHSWDFMLVGTFMAQDLSVSQKRQMRDWFVGNLVRFNAKDCWVVSQDPRDGNNGEHQMEHNGRGAYPAWPYHDGWALRSLGYPQDMVALLSVIDGATRNGAIGQGYFPNGVRCRSNWANIAGATAAAYPLHNLFGVWPGLDKFSPKPELAGFDPKARFDNVPVRGTLYRINADGAREMGRISN